ncbi:methylamine utilization protein mauG [Aquitalea magnusonii]|uniref:Methylamine utilization protein mauG n=1 Tax=Aquitalea magnusonii TaxID=332411 RepID=A0A3G9GGA5_9NEIS|nr:hypothetical protein [Aquitalea magnusonii]BBF84556.1 methylamine utilization protein mauG [Aquitalea magnusonii]
MSVKTRLEEMRFHNTGLYNLDGKGAFPEGNRGVYELTGLVEDMGKFRAPSLRNIAVTAPYMHDGSLPDLPACWLSMPPVAAGLHMENTRAMAG